jgi:integrase/recombinase XerD
MLRLRSRRGLRATAGATRQLSDGDWVQGSRRIRASKPHAERLLPLAQEGGDALLADLRTGRPATSSRHRCLAHLAPYHPLHTASAMPKGVTRLLANAGMARQSAGAQLVRHTVATPLVHRGARFTDGADGLGHHTLPTTGL